MEITLNNRKYKFELRGTVGIQFLACKLLGVVNLNLGTYENGKQTAPGDPLHFCALYYITLQLANKKFEDEIDFMHFVGMMTTELQNDLGTYFWRRYAELEGMIPFEDNNSSTQGEG